MSENTKKLDLFKYNTETDKKDTFNINLALNNNWDKLENKISISEYDENSIYPLGCWVRGVVDNERKIFESLIDNNQGNNLNNADAWEEISFAGGGLEIGDIGIAPLGIDETKGKRRYLNGQYILQEHFIAFTNKLKNAIAKYPSLVCTESEWQTIATMTVGGQVGKFVVDDNSKTIRLPKIIMPIQGLTDLSKLGEIVNAGLPTHTHTRGTMEITGQLNSEIAMVSSTASGAFSITRGSYTRNPGSGTTDLTSYTLKLKASDSWTGSTSAPNNATYGKSDTVQQEQIQYPYFIQVATGAETKDNIINEIELNNPFSLLDYKYSEYELNNASWLRSNGQWNSKALYPAVYELLLKIYNKTITKNGVSVKLSTSSYTDTDFVLNTSNETFRLPLKVKQKFYTLPSNVDIEFAGPTFGRTGFKLYNIGLYDNAGTQDWTGGYARQLVSTGSGTLGTNNKTTDGTIDYVYVGARANLSSITSPSLYLYFYVGETVQNANLVNIGRTEEILSTKTDKVQASQASMPSNKYVEFTLGASGTSYTAPANGYYLITKQSTGAGQYVQIWLDNGTALSDIRRATETGQSVNSYLPVKKGDKVIIYYTAGGTTNRSRFIYAQGEL